MMENVLISLYFIIFCVLVLNVDSRRNNIIQNCTDIEVRLHGNGNTYELRQNNVNIWSTKLSLLTYDYLSLSWEMLLYSDDNTCINSLPNIYKYKSESILPPKRQYWFDKYTSEKKLIHIKCINKTNTNNNNINSNDSITQEPYLFKIFSKQNQMSLYYFLSGIIILLLFVIVLLIWYICVRLKIRYKHPLSIKTGNHAELSLSKMIIPSNTVQINSPLPNIKQPLRNITANSDNNNNINNINNNGNKLQSNNVSNNKNNKNINIQSPGNVKQSFMQIQSSSSNLLLNNSDNNKNNNKKCTTKLNCNDDDNITDSEDKILQNMWSVTNGNDSNKNSEIEDEKRMITATQSELDVDIELNEGSVTMNHGHMKRHKSMPIKSLHNSINNDSNKNRQERRLSVSMHKHFKELKSLLNNDVKIDDTINEDEYTLYTINYDDNTQINTKFKYDFKKKKYKSQTKKLFDGIFISLYKYLNYLNNSDIISFMQININMKDEDNNLFCDLICLRNNFMNDINMHTATNSNVTASHGSHSYNNSNNNNGSLTIILPNKSDLRINRSQSLSQLVHNKLTDLEEVMSETIELENKLEFVKKENLDIKNKLIQMERDFERKNEEKTRKMSQKLMKYLQDPISKNYLGVKFGKIIHSKHSSDTTLTTTITTDDLIDDQATNNTDDELGIHFGDGLTKYMNKIIKENEQKTKTNTNTNTNTNTDDESKDELKDDIKDDNKNNDDNKESKNNDNSIDIYRELEQNLLIENENIGFDVESQNSSCNQKSEEKERQNDDDSTDTDTGNDDNNDETISNDDDDGDSKVFTISIDCIDEENENEMEFEIYREPLGSTRVKDSDTTNNNNNNLFDDDIEIYHDNDVIKELGGEVNKNIFTINETINEHLYDDTNTIHSHTKTRTHTISIDFDTTNIMSPTKTKQL